MWCDLWELIVCLYECLKCFLLSCFPCLPFCLKGFSWKWEKVWKSEIRKWCVGTVSVFWIVNLIADFVLWVKRQVNKLWLAWSNFQKFSSIFYLTYKSVSLPNSCTQVLPFSIHMLSRAISNTQLLFFAQSRYAYTNFLCSNQICIY